MGKFKNIVNKLRDDFRVLMQTLLLICCFIFPKLVNLSGKMSELFRNQAPDITNIKYFYLMGLGNFGIGLLLVILMLVKVIRKDNADYTLYSNNCYHEHCYGVFWFNAKVLGSKTCSLVLVPIYMQLKLVIRSTFEHYDFGGDNLSERSMEVDTSFSGNINTDVKEINLILEDTYPINQEQIPFEKRDLYTVKIKHKDKNDVIRIYNKNFAPQVCNVCRNLPRNTVINIFATTNAKHSYEIAKQAFLVGNRGNIAQVYVYQSNPESEWRFEEKNKLYSWLEN